MIKTICIVRLSALGDVLMLVPLIRTLQAGLPQAKLTWIISRPAYDLVADMDGVEFLVIDKPKSLADFWHFKKQMRHRQFDVLLAPQASFRTNLLYPLIKAKRKIGYDAHRAKDGHRWFVK
ncbi:MAG: glycosyltransferase family 9 protein, partial [bacterium]|nr:glycosyltransferase family 9 protein [bacterium]